VGAETGVACTSPVNCWAVAGNDAVHWTGTRWSQVYTPHSASKFNTLLGVTCARATECWAVGSYWDYPAETRLSIALHWNGTSWSTG
jgi:hypothetical protein